MYSPGGSSEGVVILQSHFFTGPGMLQRQQWIGWDTLAPMSTK